MGCGASLNQVHVLDERDGVVSKSGKRSHKKSKKADQFSVSSQDLGQGGSSLPSKVGQACRARWVEPAEHSASMCNIYIGSDARS